MRYTFLNATQERNHLWRTHECVFSQHREIQFSASLNHTLLHKPRVGLNYVLRQNLQGSSRVKQLSCAVVNNEISLISACRNMVPIMDGRHNKERAALLLILYQREMKRQIKYKTPLRVSLFIRLKNAIFVSYMCQAAGEFVIHEMQRPNRADQLRCHAEDIKNTTQYRRIFAAPQGALPLINLCATAAAACFCLLRERRERKMLRRLMSAGIKLHARHISR
jgi:hypothetical protein